MLTALCVEEAFLEYEVISPKVLDYYHTYTPPSQRGKGIAAIVSKVSVPTTVKAITTVLIPTNIGSKYNIDKAALSHVTWMHAYRQRWSTQQPTTCECT